MLFSKPRKFDILGISNSWFAVCLNRTQHGNKMQVSQNTETCNIGPLAIYIYINLQYIYILHFLLMAQGTILTPLLFIIYLNDLNDAVRDPVVSTLVFADDMTLFLSYHSYPIL